MDTNNITIKALVVTAMVVVLLLPIELVKSLIGERSAAQTEVEKEIGEKWGGGRQEIKGPILVLPYIEEEWVMDGVKGQEKGKKVIRKNLYFAADEISIVGDISAEERARTMFKTLVYQSKMNLKGSFKFTDEQKKMISAKQILYDEAYIIVSMTSMRGLKNEVIADINGRKIQAKNQRKDNSMILNGLVISGVFNQDVDPAQDVNFEFDLVVNGTQNLIFNNYAKNTHIDMKSNWATVSFGGTILPTERHFENGFSAQWDIYTENFGDLNSHIDVNNELVEIDLRYPVNDYQMNMRAVKYAVMFIALTFLVFFLVELISRKRIHPMQYILVSCGLILFYTLLLALSEHVGFDWAYLISSIAIISLISAYTLSIFSNRKQTLMMGSFLVMLYLYLYVILQLEDLALLFGSIGLFIALAIVMFVSRKIDWYNLSGTKDLDDDNQNADE